jgi:acetyl esterase/lipase
MIRMRSRLLTALALAAVPALALAQSQTLPLWPTATPEASEATAPELTAAAKNGHYPGVPLTWVTNVSQPTLTTYPVPAGIKPTGAAALVFPGGSYAKLAMVHEGSMACDWFNSLGIFCAVVKYRVPWNEHFPATYGPLEDGQQAVRILRSHADAWHLDPHRIGILGFSAGGHLAVTLSQHFDDPHILSTPAASEVDTKISARPDFVMLIYPAYLDVPTHGTTLDPSLTPNAQTPPTFITQNEDDIHYGDASLVYARALKTANVPEEFILYPNGGHGNGMHPTGTSSENWTTVAAAWLQTIKVLP